MGAAEAAGGGGGGGGGASFGTLRSMLVMIPRISRIEPYASPSLSARSPSTDRLTLSSAFARSASFAVGWNVLIDAIPFVYSLNHVARLPRALGRRSGGYIVSQKPSMRPCRRTKPSRRPRTPSCVARPAAQ